MIDINFYIISSNVDKWGLNDDNHYKGLYRKYSHSEYIILFKNKILDEKSYRRYISDEIIGGIEYSYQNEWNGGMKLNFKKN